MEDDGGEYGDIEGWERCSSNIKSWEWVEYYQEGGSEVGGAGLVELLTVDSLPAVRDLAFDEAQDTVG